MPTSKEWLLERLEQERARFGEHEHVIATYEREGFLPFHDLWNEGEQSLQLRSSHSRLRRIKVQKLLFDVYTAGGRALLYLCTLAASITQLARITPKGLLTAIGEWWERVEHPLGLDKTAITIFSSFGLLSKFPNAEKRDHGACKYV